MSSMEISDRKPDYTAQIKQEVEETVKNLLLRYSGYGEYYDNDPEYVELGYLVATHAGKDVFKEGDTVLGLPVKIGKSDFRRIALFPLVFLGKYNDCKEKESELVSETW